MTKKKIIIFFLFSCLIQNANSSENDIYKKIDLFGEVLEKINKEYVEEINQFFHKYHYYQKAFFEKIK